MTTTTTTTRSPRPVPAPERSHGPATPSSILALRAEGRTWTQVAAAAGITRDRVVTILASTGYWLDAHGIGR